MCDNGVQAVHSATLVQLDQRPAVPALHKLDICKAARTEAGLQAIAESLYANRSRAPPAAVRAGYAGPPLLTAAQLSGQPAAVSALPAVGGLLPLFLHVSSLLLVVGGVTVVLGRRAVRLRPVGPAVLVEHPSYMLVQLCRLGVRHSRTLVRLLGMLMGLWWVGR
jgi:hypothetical protein